VIRTPDRAEAQRRFKAANIGTAVHYPVPVHRQAAYAGRVALGPAGCRVTEALASDILSLPMHAYLGEAEVARVCDVLRTL
jgi:dTDP-4-amino-4,6-dideoxygalactose transaminase